MNCSALIIVKNLSSNSRTLWKWLSLRTNSFFARFVFVTDAKSDLDWEKFEKLETKKTLYSYSKF